MAIIRFFLASLLLTQAASAATSRSRTATKLPNPKMQPEACGFTHGSGTGDICNPDGILKSPGRVQAALSAFAADHEYPGCGGYEMAVAVVSHVVGSSKEDLEAFAKGAMDKWGVGKAACNNGIVLAVAVNDRKMHIATGRGASQYIPNSEIPAVIERMKPLMRETRYDEAIEQCISDLARILEGESFQPSWIARNFWWIAFCCFCCGCIGYSNREERNYARCKRALTEIEQARAEAKANQYEVKSCAICLEPFDETSKKEKRLLPCGHTFHVCCIDSWAESRGTCPICRSPTEEGIPIHDAKVSVPHHRGRATTPANYESEYNFRLHRAQRLYPNYVTSNMVDRWSAPGYNGPLVADTSFIQSSPSYKSPDSSSSDGDSSFGGDWLFGGGCSFGGGGGGGDW